MLLSYCSSVVLSLLNYLVQSTLAKRPEITSVVIAAILIKLTWLVFSYSVWLLFIHYLFVILSFFYIIHCSLHLYIMETPWAQAQFRNLCVGIRISRAQIRNLREFIGTKVQIYTNFSAYFITQFFKIVLFHYIALHLYISRFLLLYILFMSIISTTLTVLCCFICVCMLSFLYVQILAFSISLYREKQAKKKNQGRGKRTPLQFLTMPAPELLLNILWAILSLTGMNSKVCEYNMCVTNASSSLARPRQEHSNPQRF